VSSPCKERREKDNVIVLLLAQIEAIENILDGEEVSDFELSFPLIRRIYELKSQETGL